MIAAAAEEAEESFEQQLWLKVSLINDAAENLQEIPLLDMEKTDHRVAQPCSAYDHSRVGGTDGYIQA